MHEFEDDVPPPPEPRHYAFLVWTTGAAILLVPSILATFVRVVALSMRCTPGPDLCRGLALGGGLRDTLNLAWFVGDDTTVTFLIAIAAAIAALIAMRPLLAALTLLLMPGLALMAPTMVVSSALYDGCKASETGVGSCILWGEQMGMAVHRAAMTTGPIYDLAPYSFSLALMIGVIGFLFFRPKATG
jgi:hypothetical protein